MLYTFKFSVHSSVVSAWIVKLLAWWLPLLTTIFYSPVFGIILTIFDCDNGINETYDMSIHEMRCLAGQHIIHIVFSVVFASLVFCVSTMSALLLHEMKITTGINTSKVDTQFEVWFVLYRTGIILLDFIAMRDGIKWPTWLIVTVGSVAFCYMFRKRRFFSEVAQMLFRCFMFLNLWLAVVYTYVFWVEDDEEAKKLIYYFIGGSLVVAINVIYYDKNWQSMEINLANMKKPEDIIRRVLIYTDIVIRNANDESTYLVIIKGYIITHSQTCYKPVCTLRDYADLYLNKILEKQASKEAINFRSNFKNFLLHIGELIQFGISRFPKDNMLKMLYCVYLIQIANNQSCALELLNSIELNTPSFEEQFLVYHLKETIKDSLLSTSSRDAEQIKTTAVIAYNTHFSLFKEKIEKAAKLFYKYWEQLLDPIPDLSKIKDYSFVIQDLLSEISFYWKQMQILDPNSPITLRLYATFTDEILNDRRISEQMLVKVKNISTTRFNLRRKHLQAVNSSNISSISSDGEACIFVSGKNNNISIITQANAALCSIFGYPLMQLIGKNVEELMPGIFAKYHEEVMLNSLESYSKWEDRMKEIHVFGKLRTGYIIPMWLTILSVPTLLNNVNFIGIMRLDEDLDKLDTVHLLLDLDKLITDMSSTGRFYLGSLNMVIKQKVSLERIFPKLNLGEEIFKKVELEAEFYPVNVRRDVEIMKEEKKIMNVHIETLEMKDKGKVGYWVKFLPAIIQISNTPSRNIEPNLFEFKYNNEANKYIRRFGVKKGKSRAELDLFQVTQSLFLKQFHLRNMNPEDNKVSEESSSPKAMVKRIAADMAKFKTPFFQTATFGIQNMIRLLSVKERAEYRFPIDTNFELLITKKWINYGNSVRTLRVIGNELIAVTKSETKEFIIGDLLDTETITKRNNKHIRKESAFLISSNIKGRDSLENFLAQEKKIIIKFMHIMIYLVFFTLFAFAIVNYVKLTSFFNEIANRIHIVDVTYQRLVAEQAVMYNIKDIWLIQTYF